MSSRPLLTLATLCLLSATLWPNLAQARCMSDFHQLWPPDASEIDAQQLFTLETMRPPAEEALQGMQLKLDDVSGKRSGSVALVEVARYTGKMRHIVVYRPSEALPAGALVSWRFDAGERTVSQSWRVARAPLTSYEIEAPGFVDTSYRRLGCGPSKHANFSLSTAPTSPTLVLATLTPKHGETTSYPIQLAAGERTLSVGHGMCGGPFAMRDGATYALTLQNFLKDGSLSEHTTPAVRFTAPAPTH